MSKHPDCGCGHPWREHIDNGTGICSKTWCDCRRYDPPGPTTCPKCRAEVPDGAHCGRCGTAVAQPVDEPEAQRQTRYGGHPWREHAATCLWLGIVTTIVGIMGYRVQRHESEIDALVRNANAQTESIVALNAAATRNSK